MQQRACIDYFDVMDCKAAYQFCDEVMGSAFDKLGTIVIPSTTIL